LSDQPGVSAFTARTPRVVRSRKLLHRKDRDAHRLFLVEGPQAVREAVGAGVVDEVYGTAAALDRYRDLLAGTRVSMVTDEALASLSETVHPQGVVAVCSFVDVSLEAALARRPRLVAACVDIRDPGNAGTVLRTADAAGAGAVIFAGETVDPYNGKCVRSTAGSLFHLDVVRSVPPLEVIRAARAGGLRVLAATGHGEADLDELADRGELGAPTAWLFGSEAHGLPAAVLAAADLRVRVPLHGRAESLNLAAAAAICLYASARSHR
jgi:TrmH family RNA methyltransferase